MARRPVERETFRDNPFHTVARGQVLGRGAFGIVYQATATYPNGEALVVAVKQLDIQPTDIGTQVEINFQQEAAILCRLDHPNIVRSYSRWNFPWTTPDGGMEIPSAQPNAIVMEYAPQGSLAGLLAGCRANNTPLRWHQRIKLATEIGQGLHYLHDEQNLMHLDLKPENVLLHREAQGLLTAKLADFGLTQTRATVTVANRSTSPKGTFGYMGPEILSRRPNPSSASDIYAYAIILWGLVTLRVPYEGMQMLAIIDHVREGARLEIPEEAQCTPPLVGLIERCWEQDPNNRPNAQTVIQDITTMAEQDVQLALQIQTGRLEDRLERQAQELLTRTEERDQVATERTAAQAQSTELEAALTQVRSERDGLRNQRATARQECDHLRAQLERLQGELGQQRENQTMAEAEAQTRIAALQGELMQRTAELAQSEALVREALEQRRTTTTTTTPSTAPTNPPPAYSVTVREGLFGSAGGRERQAVAEAVSPRLLQQFLNHVVMGEQEQAEAMLEATPALALAHGDVDDLPNGMRDLEGQSFTRHFEHITGFQYALWAGDWHMWRMLQTYLPEAAQREQVAAIVTDEAPWVVIHGRFFDLQPLVKALQTYVDQYSMWNTAQRKKYWCQTIGGLQRLLPVHVINEYCRADRSFHPVPDFRESTALPRQGYVDDSGNERGVNWWFTKRPHGACRGRRCHIPSLSPYFVSADVVCLDSLSNTRRQQVEALVESLNLNADVMGTGMSAV